MKTRKLSYQQTHTAIDWLNAGGNFIGAALTFFFLSYIDPTITDAATPSDAVIRTADYLEIGIFIAFMVILIVGITIATNRTVKQMNEWHEKISSGSEKAEALPDNIARQILNYPLSGALLNLVAWLIALTFFSVLAMTLQTGILIGAVFTMAPIYFGIELLWRNVIPDFFPAGGISQIKAFRVSVQRRLFFFFVMIGMMPMLLMLITLFQRASIIATAENQELVFNNLMISQIFIAATSLVASVLLSLFLARTITDPLDELRTAMQKVEENDLTAKVSVNSNDELGYLSEGFNEMTSGLQQGEQLRRLFNLYVSPEVARAAVETGAGLGGELVTCTVLFSDIRGFTTLAEQLTAEELVELINGYMTAMVQVITQHGGVVTQFGGDSILAVFGTPLNPMNEHAYKAVDAAIDMRTALQAFNHNPDNAEKPDLTAGIGIATGLVVSGNVGGEERIEYTVMGDAVNLASRLQDLTKEFEQSILISESTFAAINENPALTTVLIPEVKIKGKQQTTNIYALNLNV